MRAVKDSSVTLARGSEEKKSLLGERAQRMAVRPPLREGVRKQRRDTFYLLQLKQRFPTLFLLLEQYGEGFRYLFSTTK